MSLGQHASFIVGSYAVSALVIVALIGWIVADYAAQRRILGELEERGIKRRSQGPLGDAS